MLHHKLSRNPEEHYGVNVSTTKSCVLVQLQDMFGSQARVTMTPEEARKMAGLLNKYANEIEIHRRKTKELNRGYDHGKVSREMWKSTERS